MSKKYCTFFGHRDAPEEIVPKLREIIVNMIEQNEVYDYLVGNNGGFDYKVKKSIKRVETVVSIY